MPETLHFVNDGYGWACKRCGAAGGAPEPAEATSLPRFFREGEAEDREPRLSSPLLARWKDETRRALVCPRCGTEESMKDEE
ncbi:MAG: hypothetical protein M3416_08695 [Acidobacteriota bacterium]|nr:hypothetical protein [Acidobacteriota bacterium]